MKKEKKTFANAEAEVITFEQNHDIVTESPMTIIAGSDEPIGGDDPFAD